MFGLFCFALAVLASPFKSKNRLEAENAALRHQWIVLPRKMLSRVRLTADFIATTCGSRDSVLTPCQSICTDVIFGKDRFSEPTSSGQTITLGYCDSHRASARAMRMPEFGQ